MVKSWIEDSATQVSNSCSIWLNCWHECMSRCRVLLAQLANISTRKISQSSGCSCTMSIKTTS
jgi:hypothetical protein